MTNRPPSDEPLVDLESRLSFALAVATTDQQGDRAQDLFQEQETLIASLEKENRKLTDKLNRFRNLTPGRKRLYALGRVAALLEYKADQIAERAASRQGSIGEKVAKIERLYENATRHDALYLHRLQWDLEQLREVVYPSKQPSHEWRRP